MPFPLVLFDLDLGADGALASGAGPATAITGTQARTGDGGGTRVGLFGAGSLSAISALGDHLLYLATGSGRKFFRITAVKDSVQTPTCNTTEFQYDLTNVSSTAGLSIGDLIEVLGVDCHVTNIAGSTVTVDQQMPSSSTGVTLTDPRQVTVEDSLTLGTDTAWAVGGKRKEPKGTGSAQIASDGKAGWKVRFLYPASELPYEFSAAWACSASGNTTDGKITIEGDPGSSKRPVLKGTTAIQLFNVTGRFWHFEHLGCTKCETGILLSAAAAEDFQCLDCKFFETSSSEWITYGIRMTSACTGERFLLNGCEFSYPVTAAIQVDGALKGLTVEGCFLHAGGSPTGISLAAAVHADIRKCLFQRLATGISMSGSGQGHSRIEQNTFDYVSQAIISLTLDRNRGIIIRGNTFSNASSRALDMATGTDLVKGIVDYNNFWANNSNRAGVSAGPNDTSFDPEFVDAPSDPLATSTFDFRVGIKLRGKSWPKSIPGSATNSVEDIGCAQREEPLGGDVIARIKTANLLLPAGLWEFGYEMKGGTKTGLGNIAALAQNALAAGEPNEAALIEALKCFLRDTDNDGYAARGKEIRI